MPSLTRLNFKLDKQLVLRAAILLTFLLIYPLRHLTTTSDGLIDEENATGFVPKVIVPIAELIFPLLLIILYRKLQWRPTIKGLLGWVVGFFVVYALSSIAYFLFEKDNHALVQLFAAFRFYFRWVGPFLVGLLLFERRDARWLLAVCAGLAFLQLPLTVAQSLRVYKRDYAGDFITGLMGLSAGGYLLIFNLSAIAFLFVFYLYGKLKWYYLLGLSALLAVPIGLGDLVFGFIMLLVLPFLVLLTLEKQALTQWRRGLMTFGVMLAIWGVAAVSYTLVFPNPLTSHFTPKSIESASVSDVEVIVSGSSTANTFTKTNRRQAGRIKIMSIINEALVEKPAYTVLGLGPGTGSSSTVAGPGKFVAAHEDYIEGVSMLSGFILVELGYLGSAVWLGFVLFILWRLEINKRAMLKTGDPDLPIMTGVQAVVLILAICMPYNLSFLSTELIYPVWLLIGWACMVRITPLENANAAA